MYGCQQVLVSQDKDLVAILTFLCKEANKLTSMGIYSSFDVNEVQSLSF